MNVPQLLEKLIVGPDIEIVVSLLPEMRSLADQPPRHTLLQRLDRIRERVAFRLTHEQMNMLGHDHVPIHAESVSAPDAFNSRFESPFR